MGKTYISIFTCQVGSAGYPAAAANFGSSIVAYAQDKLCLLQICSACNLHVHSHLTFADVQGISLKAQLELQRQSYRKAAKILTLSPSTPAPEGTPSPDRATPDSRAAASRASSDPRAGPAKSSQQDGARQIGMLSNMGCVQHALRKSNTAALCFAQALRTCAQTTGQDQVRHKHCCRLVLCTHT